MTIIERPINGFKSTLRNSKLNYPQSTNPNAPRFFFNMLSVASRGGSKTYTMVKLIKDYENHKLIDNDGIIHPLRTILISPTYDANPIFKNLKSLSDDDIYSEYNDDIFQNIMDDIEDVKEEIKEFKEYKDAYILVDKTPKKDIPNLFKNNPNIFNILEKYDYQHYKSIPQPRYNEMPINIIIMDDLVGSDAFSNKSKSLLTYYLLRNRHYMISFCMLVQNLKSVPKKIRSNCNLYILGKFASEKVILQDLYEEISNVLTEEQFQEIYNHAVKDKKYGNFIIDNTGDVKRFYTNFEKELIVEN